VYAGCVYWPFPGHQKIGLTLAAVILVAGIIDAAVKALRAR
jgi:hypothetical protein